MKDHRQIYLLGNPFVWWLSTASIVLYAIARGVLILRDKRGYQDFNRTGGPCYSRFSQRRCTLILCAVNCFDSFNFFQARIRARSLRPSRARFAIKLTHSLFTSSRRQTSLATYRSIRSQPNIIRMIQLVFQLLVLLYRAAFSVHFIMMLWIPTNLSVEMCLSPRDSNSLHGIYSMSTGELHI